MCPTFRFDRAAPAGSLSPQERLELVLEPDPRSSFSTFIVGKQRIEHADAIEWLRSAPRQSISAVVTDPPYGFFEYEPVNQKKLRAGRGGVWRIPPSFDGAKRRALPRFTVLSRDDKRQIYNFYLRFGTALLPVLKPGAHMALAANVLLSPLVASALGAAGLERRGEIVRLVRTFRGGDKPKGAESEFPMISTMPRSCWEPWLLYRSPIAEQTVARNLRKYGVGGLRRQSLVTPFLDVIESETAPDAEREVADHPSLKPQRFLRAICRAVLPLDEGSLLDPFSGSGSTIAACEFQGIAGIGLERDYKYFSMSIKSVPRLAAMY